MPFVIFRPQMNIHAPRISSLLWLAKLFVLQNFIQLLTSVIYQMYGLMPFTDKSWFARHKELRSYCIPHKLTLGVTRWQVAALQDLINNEFSS